MRCPCTKVGTKPLSNSGFRSGQLRSRYAEVAGQVKQIRPARNSKVFVFIWSLRIQLMKTVELRSLSNEHGGEQLRNILFSLLRKVVALRKNPIIARAIFVYEALRAALSHVVSGRGQIPRAELLKQICKIARGRTRTLRKVAALVEPPSRA